MCLCITQYGELADQLCTALTQQETDAASLQYMRHALTDTRTQLDSEREARTHADARTGELQTQLTQLERDFAALHEALETIERHAQETAEETDALREMMSTKSAECDDALLQLGRAVERVVVLEQQVKMYQQQQRQQQLPRSASAECVSVTAQTAADTAAAAVTPRKKRAARIRYCWHRLNRRSQTDSRVDKHTASARCITVAACSRYSRCSCAGE